jgi:hypothetical protein
LSGAEAKTRQQGGDFLAKKFPKKVLTLPMPLISSLARMVLKARVTAPEAGPKNGLPGNGVSREKQTNNNQKSKMKLTNKIVALTGIVAFAATPLFAGTGKTFKETVVVEEEVPWYNASLSTGFDSLYMYRGANVLGTGQWGGYGDALYWTNASFTWNITDVDALTLGTWMAFGLGNTAPYDPGYKELNVPVKYTRSIDNWTLGLGYTFYAVFGPGYEYYANELNVSAAYDFDLGFMTVTPSVTYFFNLGPDRDTGGGSVAAASSYLDLRLTGSIPLYKDIVSLSPYTALGLNFGYNYEGVDADNLNYFSGFNNWEGGVSMPIALSENITLSGYVAYSYAFVNINGSTLPSTFWGGANLAFAF